MAIAPSAELTSVMIGKEVTFASAATPSVTLIANANFSGTNDYIQRPYPRKRIGRTKPMTGLFLGKGSLECEADPDTLGAILALVFGAEAIAPGYTQPTLTGTASGSGGTFTATGLYRYKVVFKNANTVATGTNQAAYAATITGQSAESAQINVTATTNTVALTIGAAPAGSTFMDIYRTAAAGASGSEMLIASNQAVATTYTDNGVANGTVAIAGDVYAHTFTLASPRSSFTAQVNRVNDVINFLGNKAVSLDLSINPKSMLIAKLATAYANEAVAGTPQTPAYSTLYPFVFETQGNFGNVNGVAADATIQSFGVQINTGLVPDYPKFGNGRFPAAFPEQTTVVSGPLTLAFETTTMYKNFWGSSTATGPQSIVAPLALDYKFVSTDQANVNTAYSFEMILGTALIETCDVPIQAGKYLTQACKFQMYESTNGAADDAKCVLVNLASAASL